MVDEGEQPPPPADADSWEPLYRLLEYFASRLPQGALEDDVRRSVGATLAALREQRGIEDGVRELVITLHQLDEDIIGGQRRRFQRNAPALGRLLEVLQEELLPLLRRAGHRV